MNEAIINEQKELNGLLNGMLDIIGDEEKPNTKEIDIIERNEDNIKVKAKEGFSDYQFSLDGKNWSSKQDSPEYTFTGLEKVYFEPSDTDYNEIPTGNKYTVYAKSKKK